MPILRASRTTMAAAWRYAVVAPVEQQRPVRAAGQRLVDRLVRAWVERDLGGLVAFADDPQGRLVPRATEIAHVRAARLGDAEPVQSEQADQRVAVASFVLSRREEVGQFVAVQPWLRPAVTAWPPYACGGVADVDLFLFEPGEPRRQRGDPPPQCRVRGFGTCCSSWRR
jgi:hypothetical protein